MTSRVQTCFEVDLKTKVISQMHLSGERSGIAAGLRPGCHVGRSPVPAFPDQNSRWFMLLIFSGLDCVCSKSRDVNTEFKGVLSSFRAAPLLSILGQHMVLPQAEAVQVQGGLPGCAADSSQ